MADPNADPSGPSPAPDRLARTPRQVVGLALGLVLALGLQLFPAPEALSREAWVVASLALLMAVWWVSEAIPIAATALLPLVVLPLAGVSSFAEAARGYAHPVVMLLLGGFIIAKGVERWNLHTRIALGVVARAGSHPAALVAGFMLASALLSMWISNTATTLMMAPIALSVAALVAGAGVKTAPITYCLLLGTAYAASIGGSATPVGTPTNLIVIGFLQDNAGVSISFTQWVSFALPIAAVLVPAAWWVLTQWAYPLKAGPSMAAHTHVREELRALGPLTTPEARTLGVFAVVATLWVFGQPLKGLSIAGFTPFAGLTDHVTAILGALLLFLIPSGSARSRSAPLLDWETATTIPWGVYLLFGGGLSLAGAITSTGLAALLGEQLSIITVAPRIIIVLALVTFVILATELTSNVATVSALTPVVLAVAAAGDVPPGLLAGPIAIAASCAFMLPMATGPNAIAFASGGAPMAVMIRAGARLNLAAVLIITGMSMILAPMTLS